MVRDLNSHNRSRTGDILRDASQKLSKEYRSYDGKVDNYGLEKSEQFVRSIFDKRASAASVTKTDRKRDLAQNYFSKFSS